MNVFLNVYIVGELKKWYFWLYNSSMQWKIFNFKGAIFSDEKVQDKDLNLLNPFVQILFKKKDIKYSIETEKCPLN